MYDELMGVKDTLTTLKDKERIVGLSKPITILDNVAKAALRRLKDIREDKNDCTFFSKSAFIKPGHECMVKDTVSFNSNHINLGRVWELQTQLHILLKDLTKLKGSLQTSSPLLSVSSFMC